MLENKLRHPHVSADRNNLTVTLQREKPLWLHYVLFYYHLGSKDWGGMLFLKHRMRVGTIRYLSALTKAPGATSLETEWYTNFARLSVALESYKNKSGYSSLGQLLFLCSTVWFPLCLASNFLVLFSIYNNKSEQSSRDSFLRVLH
jgi:hypothetical protein